MQTNYSFGEVLNAGNTQAETQAGAKQMKQFLQLFLHTLALPIAYAVSVLLNAGPAAVFQSRGFSALYWLSVCLFMIIVSQKRRKLIRDPGLRTFYMIAMAAIPFMLALNMTGLL